MFGFNAFRPLLFSDTSIDRLSTVDSRQAELVMAAPGGSLGEFASALASLDILADTMDQNEVREHAKNEKK